MPSSSIFASVVVFEPDELTEEDFAAKITTWMRILQLENEEQHSECLTQ
jgi:hypothetical protein